MIEFLADDYDIRSRYMIHKDWVYKKLQYIQAYCNGIKPVAYVGEPIGKLIFNIFKQPSKIRAKSNLIILKNGY